MRKIISLFLAAIVLSAATGMPVFAEHDNERKIEIHVAVNGNDNGSGSIDSPLKTLDAARKKARELKKDRPIEVIFHGGDYRYNKGVRFTAEDSGSEKARITYKAADGEKVKFKGSIPLNVKEFQRVSDEKIYARLPESSRDYVGELDLKQFGVTTVANYPQGAGGNKGVNGYSLYLQEDRQQIARWPNNGLKVADKILDKNSRLMQINDIDITRWGSADLSQLYISGFFSTQYAFDRYRIAGINVHDKTIKVSTGEFGLPYSRFYIFNFLEELDAPGEWVIDSNTMKLYYFPEHKLSDEQLELSILTEPMIKLEETANLSFEGFEFSQTCGDVFQITGAEGLRFTKNKFTEIGRTAILDTQFNNEEGANYKKTSNILVQNNAFINTYCQAMCLSGGRYDTLEPSGHVVDNNYFNGFGLDTVTYASAVRMSGVGGEITHNVMHNASSNAIQPVGNDTKIMYNEIYDVCRDVHDAGAIYAGRNKMRRGVEIAYNYIHDLETIDKNVGDIVCGIYMDDSLSEWYMHHNIIENIPRGIFMGGSDDALVYNNIFVDCKAGLRLGFYFPVGDGVRAIINDGIEYVKKYPIYLERYPKLAKAKLSSEKGANGNEFYENLFVESMLDVSVEAMKDNLNRVEGNLEIFNKSEIQFVDAAHGNYEIKEEDKVLEEIPELSRIKMSEIGLYGDMNVEDYVNDIYKIYPRNGENLKVAAKVAFRWDKSYVADKYRLVIATDSKMENIVLDTITRSNYANIENVLEADKTYYWNVEAIDISVNNLPGKKAEGAPYMFTTAKYEDANKTYLLSAIEKADAIMQGLAVGDKPGECSQEAFDAYREVYGKSAEEFAKKRTTQAAVDLAAQQLEFANKDINSKINPGYFDLSALLDSKEKWTFHGEKSTLENGVITFQDSIMTTNADMSGYELIAFRMKTGDQIGMIALTMRTLNSELIWGATGYTLIIKDDVIEYQRYKQGSGGGIIKTVPNNSIRANEWIDVEVGAIDYDQGIKIILRINGEEVLNEYDESGIITEYGKFQIENFKDTTMLITGMEQLPEFRDEILTGRLAPVEPRIVKTFDPRRPMEGNEIFDVNMKLNLMGTGQEIGLRADAEGNQYKLIFQENKLGLQRITREGICQLAYAENTFIRSGEAARLTFGAYPTKDGMRVLLFVNEERVFDYTDVYAKHAGNSLVFYDLNKKGYEIAG